MVRCWLSRCKVLAAFLLLAFHSGCFCHDLRFAARFEGAARVGPQKFWFFHLAKKKGSTQSPLPHRRAQLLSFCRCETAWYRGITGGSSATSHPSGVKSSQTWFLRRLILHSRISKMEVSHACCTWTLTSNNKSTGILCGCRKRSANCSSEHWRRNRAIEMDRNAAAVVDPPRPLSSLNNRWRGRLAGLLSLGKSGRNSE